MHHKGRKEHGAEEPFCSGHQCPANGWSSLWGRSKEKVHSRFVGEALQQIAGIASQNLSLNLKAPHSDIIWASTTPEAVGCLCAIALAATVLVGLRCLLDFLSSRSLEKRAHPSDKSTIIVCLCFRQGLKTQTLNREAWMKLRNILELSSRVPPEASLTFPLLVLKLAVCCTLRSPSRFCSTPWSSVPAGPATSSICAGCAAAVPSSRSPSRRAGRTF